MVDRGPLEVLVISLLPSRSGRDEKLPGLDIGRAQVQTALDPAGAASLVPKFCETQDGTVHAQSSGLYLNRRWSSQYAHGSDSIRPVGEVVENLLKDGEDISAVDDVRFLSLVLAELCVFARRDAKPTIPEGYTLARPAIEAVFSTSTGNKIYASAYPTKQPIRAASENGSQLVCSLSKDFEEGFEKERLPSGNEKLTFDLSQGPLRQLKSADATVDLRISTVMELFLRAYKVVFKRRSLSGSGFAAGLKDLKLPSRESFPRINKLAVEWSTPFVPTKVTVNGFHLIELNFSLCEGTKVLGAGTFVLANIATEAASQRSDMNYLEMCLGLK